MRILSPEAAALLGKELRQVLRSRSALMSAAFLPLLLLVVVPGFQLLTIAGARGPRAGGAAVSSAGAAIQGGPPGIAGLSGREVFAYYLLPLFVTLAAALTPGVASIYTIVVERERRTIELLVSLPVTVGDIVTAKLTATLITACTVMVPLALVDAVVGAVAGGAGIAYALLMVLLLLGGILFSVCVAFVLALLARDYRTSQQINGLFVAPVLVLTNAVLILVPGVGRLLVLAVLLAGMGTAGLYVAARRFTFERYLS